MGDLQQASPIPANIPKGVVTEWGVDDVRNWLSQSMQLPQYLQQFEGIPSALELTHAIVLLGVIWRLSRKHADECVENEIAGDVLVHLDHDALKDLEVTSVGHRLYNLKIAHGVKFEKDDYVPICNPSPTSTATYRRLIDHSCSKRR